MIIICAQINLQSRVKSLPDLVLVFRVYSEKSGMSYFGNEQDETNSEVWHSGSHLNVVTLAHMGQSDRIGTKHLMMVEFKICLFMGFVEFYI